MSKSKKTVEELFNEQPASVKKLINFLANKAYKQGYRDASTHYETILKEYQDQEKAEIEQALEKEGY